MSEDLGVLIAKLQADVSNIKRNLRAGRQELSSFRDFSQNVGSQVKKALSFVGVALGLYEIASAVKRFGVDAALTGARTETLGVGLEVIAENAGLSREALQFFIQEVKEAGITTQQSMLAITSFLTPGLNLNQLKDLATRARDIASGFGKDTSETLNKIIHGIVSGQTEIFRTLHIPVRNADVVWKEYAGTLGKTKDELSAVEKQQAMLNEVMRASAGYAGQAARMDETVGKQLKSMARYAEEARNALWPLFGPIMEAGVQELTQGWKDLKTWADANKDSLREWGREVGSWVRTIADIIRATGKFIIENRELLKTIGELWILNKILGLFLRFEGLIKRIPGFLRDAGFAFAALRGQIVAVNTALSGGIVLLAKAMILMAYYATKRKDFKPVMPDDPWLLAPEGPAEGKPQVPAKPQLTYPGTQTIEDKIAAWRKLGMTEAQVIAQIRAEADRAAQKAKEAAPEPEGKKSRAGRERDFTNYLIRETDAQKQLRLAVLEADLEAFRAAAETKKTILRQQYDEGKISGEVYYRTMGELARDELNRTLNLINEKRTAETAAYEEKKARLEASARDETQKKAELARLDLDYRKKLVELDKQQRLAREEFTNFEAQRLSRLAQESKEIERTLKEQDWATVLGPLEEREASINRFLYEQIRLRDELRRKMGEQVAAGRLTPEMMSTRLAAFDESTRMQEWIMRQGDHIRAHSQVISGAFSDLVGSILEGGADLVKSLNYFFKNLLNTALGPGLEALEQMLTGGLKKLFGAAGQAVATSLLAVVGLIGMFLTSGGGGSSFTPTGVTSSITGHEAVRGIIAGDTTIPIGKIGDNLKEALVETNDWLRLIEGNTRRLGGGAGFDREAIINAVAEGLERYYAGALQMMPS